MSGTICRIIIQGNRAQANTRYTIDTLALNAAARQKSEQLIGGFQSLCNLGTGTYDGVEIMTDAQQAEAVTRMSAYNDDLGNLLVNAHPNRDKICALIARVLDDVNVLLDAVTNNPEPELSIPTATEAGVPLPEKKATKK